MTENQAGRGPVYLPFSIIIRFVCTCIINPATIILTHLPLLPTHLQTPTFCGVSAPHLPVGVTHLSPSPHSPSSGFCRDVVSQTIPSTTNGLVRRFVTNAYPFSITRLSALVVPTAFISATHSSTRTESSADTTALSHSCL